jgi:ribulose-phosphate 3-epimerase
LERLNQDIWLQVDGGISVETISTAAMAGADAFVGSAVYRAESPAMMLKSANWQWPLRLE